MLTLFLGHQLLGIYVQLGTGRRVEGHHPELVRFHLVQHMIGIVGIRVRDECVTLGNQPVQILVGRPENPAKHPHWQLAGDFRRCVEFLHRKNRTQDILAQSPDLPLELSHDAFRERVGNLHPGVGVLWRVGFLKRAAGEIFLVCLVFHPDASCRGQPLEVAIQIEDVGMAGYIPEPRPLVPVGPFQRCLTAHPEKCVMGSSVHETVMAGKIRMSVVGRSPNRHLLFPSSGMQISSLGTVSVPDGSRPRSFRSTLKLPSLPIRHHNASPLDCASYRPAGFRFAC